MHYLMYIAQPMLSFEISPILRPPTKSSGLNEITNFFITVAKLGIVLKSPFTLNLKLLLLFRLSRRPRSLTFLYNSPIHSYSLISENVQNLERN